MTEQILHLPVDKVVPDPHQPRRTFTEAELRELAESIKQDGLIQPVEVRPLNGSGQYMLIQGERRYRAHQLAGLPTIRAIVNNTPLTAVALGTRQYAENAHRQDLNPIDEAEWFAWMLKQTGEDGKKLTITRLAQLSGRNSTHINNRLKWLELEPAIQNMVRDGRLPKDIRAAHALLTISDGKVRMELAEALAERHATIPAIEAACGNVRKKLEAAQVGNNLLSNKNPMLALSVNGNSLSPNGRISNTTMRQMAQQMCAACSLSDLVTTSEPAWHLVMEAAGETCRACGMEDVLVCRECPGVELLRRIAGVMAANAREVNIKGRPS